jgi:WbqC-like protein family
MSGIVFPSASWAPLSWYSLYLRASHPRIEIHENYRKQTWRNRYRIMGPNGMQDLIVPIYHIGNHTPMHEMRIDYSMRWQQKQWGAITSAYRQSPFFAFYEDHWRPFFEEKQYEKLIDLNQAIHLLTLRLLKVKTETGSTETFVAYSENDLRLLLSPKNKVKLKMEFPKYIQVFSERHGFIPDLSILDLLCCCGPQATDYLLHRIELTDRN